MKNKIITLLIALLIPILAFADNQPFIRQYPALTPLPAAVGQQSHAVVDQYGNISVGGAGALQLGKAEDSASADGDIGIPAYFVREDALTANTGTSGDYTPGKTDNSGRQIVTYAPPGETWQSCGTATAVTSNVAIKAAVASNRMYVKSITCKNTSATVATSIDFLDGSTVIAVGAVSEMATVAAGSFTAIFPVPLRGTSNTALNFATNVAVTSVTCCAAGYVSTQ